jgi:hypothetical protein
MLSAQITFPDAGDATAWLTTPRSREAPSQLKIGGAPAPAVIRHAHAGF